HDASWRKCLPGMPRHLILPARRQRMPGSCRDRHLRQARACISGRAIPKADMEILNCYKWPVAAAIRIVSMKRIHLTLAAFACSITLNAFAADVKFANPLVLQR